MTPVKVAGLGVVTQVTAGQTHACAISDGAVYCWGANASGQVGNGSNTGVTTPTKVGGLIAGATATAVDAGEAHTCAVAGGAAYCWGANSYGQLGNASTTASNIPVKVTSNAALAGTATSVSAGRYYSCAIASGAASCWGYGGYNNIGNGNAAGGTTPLAVTTAAGTLSGKTVTSISASDRATCATADGALTCWGSNYAGQLGDGSATSASQASPVLIADTGPNPGLPADVTVSVSSKGYTRSTVVKLSVAVK
jgi:alpha-tubulin suppressor-like RCC1 family protein